jgi:hypothetical protein
VGIETVSPLPHARDGFIIQTFLEKKRRKSSRISVNKYSFCALFLVQEVKKLFDWAIFLKIILAVLQAILQNLPVV